MTEPFEPYITEPGVYDIPMADYLRDPVVGGSLTNSGAKKLMPPGCPALFKAWRDGLVEKPKAAFDFGRAAHRVALGAGDDIVVVKGTGKDPEAWTTNEAKAKVAAVRAAGKTPIKPKDVEQVNAMAAALRQHPFAAALLDPALGKPEQCLVWRDPESDVMCRALVDFLRHHVPGRRTLLPDYKTADKVDRRSIERALYDYGYYGQGPWYADGLEQLGLTTGPPVFQLVMQMNAAPYLVVVAEPDPDAIAWGHARNRKARDLYRVCSERDEWPGFADHEPMKVQLPSYAIYELEAAQTLGHLEIEGAVL